MQRYQVSVLIEADHARMVAFSDALGMVLPAISDGVKIIQTVIAEPVKNLYTSQHQQPTEHNAP